MKTTMHLLSLLFLVMLMGCSKEINETTTTTKTVVYDINMEKIESDAELTFTGEFIDQTGRTISVSNAELPFHIELKNVPSDVKTGFSGRLFSVNATELIGTVTMKVIEMPNNKVIYDNKKSMNHTYGGGFTSAELREKTSFNFIEQ